VLVAVGALLVLLILQPEMEGWKFFTLIILSILFITLGTFAALKQKEAVQ
jgi:NADH:ubiquinone oxidoreductase subunit 2 (subunit N)